MTITATPNCNFPAANPYGIPDLLPEWQADFIDLPLQPWGGTSPHWRPSRQKAFPGTWHFYIDDFKFASLFRDPHRPLGTASPTFCELNYSLGDCSPRYVALHVTGKKRWVSRYWQSQGRRILVDLNVPPVHLADNLIGVPAGWRAYSTRAADRDLPHLRLQHQAAIDRAGTEDLVMIVIGGGRKIRDYCSRHALQWHPSHVVQIKASTTLEKMRKGNVHPNRKAAAHG